MNGRNQKVNTNGRNMDEVQQDISQWAEETFEHDELGICAHMLAEAAEAYFVAGGAWPTANSIIHHAYRDKIHDKEANLPEEAADVCILAMCLAGYQGFSLNGMVEAKMYRNRKRDWGEPNELGFTEHTREYPPRQTIQGE